MSRQARVVAEAVPHHVTQRGNNRQDIFLTDDDRRFYIDLLREKCEQFGVSLLGYCLMTNHVHFVAVPRRADSLAKTLGQTHWRYAMRFNRRYRRSGHLWQNRFYSCPLGPSHLLAALAYVDVNPVRAGLVGDAAQYPWSSARARTWRAAIHFACSTIGSGSNADFRLTGPRLCAPARATNKPPSCAPQPPTDSPRGTKISSPN